jgi:hypothetical protein
MKTLKGIAFLASRNAPSRGAEEGAAGVEAPAVAGSSSAESSIARLLS